MNKLSCDIIRDLLPLYKDHVCSEKSRELVDGHLKECESCQKLLATMNEELPPIGLSREHMDAQNHPENDAFDSAVMDALAGDVKTFRKIAKRLSLARLIPLCSFALIIVLIVMSVISNTLYWKIPGFDRRVKAEDVRITELYQLEDGNLYFTLESNVPFKIPAYTSSFSPDAMRSSPSYGNGKSKVNFEKCSSFEENILEKPCFRQCSFAVPLTEIIYMEEPDVSDPESVIHEITSVCYEGKSGSQLAVWEKGQKIEAAPEKVEERVMQEQDRQENHPDEYSGGYERLPEYENGILFVMY